MQVFVSSGILTNSISQITQGKDWNLDNKSFKADILYGNIDTSESLKW